MILSRQKQVLSRYRQRVRAVQAERQTLEAALMGTEALVEGCLVVVRTVCGKAGCRCRTSKRRRHGPYLHLSLLRKGKTRMIHLPRQWEEAARKGVEAARRFRKAHRQWRALNGRMESLWKQVERNRRYLPYEPKKKDR